MGFCKQSKVSNGEKNQNAILIFRQAYRKYNDIRQGEEQMKIIDTLQEKLNVK